MSQPNFAHTTPTLATTHTIPNPPTQTYHMVTHAQVSTVKPNPCFHGYTSHISPISHIPESPFIALSNPNWRDAMYDEYNALIKNSTWVLVSKPPNVNVVRSMWLFRHKYHADGSLSSLVVKPATIRTVLNLALSRNWSIHQLDVKNAFLNGDLSETILKQAPRAWFQRFAGYANMVGFSLSHCDSSLFIYQHGFEVAYLLIYADDIVLTTSSMNLLQRIISSLYKEFDTTDLGALNYFLGISITCDSTSMFLSQKKYDLELLDRARMANCNPTRTPVDKESKLGSDADPICDPTLYRSLAGEPNLAALKRVLRYVRGTLDFGLQLYASITGSLVAYIDADWVGYPTTRRSTSGVANVVAETAWLRNIFRELHTPLLSATLVYCDNVSAIYITANPVQHQRTKHIEIDKHFIRDIVVRGQVRVLHVPYRYQYADIFTKGLPSALFEEFCTSLSVRPSPAQTAGAY
ncbi:ribonuclease H-like domain-containing protein [Tanacetum coccineum]